MQPRRCCEFAHLEAALVAFLCKFFGQTGVLSDGELCFVELHFVALHQMSQVFISILHRHHSSLVLIEHQEFAVTYFAYLAIDLLSVLQRDRVWKVARAQAAGLAVFHRAELAHIRLLKEILAAEAMCLFALYFVARCIIFHLELKDHLIRIESMRCSIYTNGHHCLHLLPLVACLPLVLLLDLDHLIV